MAVRARARLRRCSRRAGGPAAGNGCCARPGWRSPRPSAEDQVAFPVPGDGPVGRLGRPLADHLHVGDPAAALVSGARLAPRPPRPQVALSPTQARRVPEQTGTDRSARATPASPDPQGSRVGSHPATLGRPPKPQLGLHHHPYPRLQHQLGRFWAAGPWVERGGVGRLGPRTASAATRVSSLGGQPSIRARRSRALIRRIGSPAGDTAADLFAFGHATGIRVGAPRWVPLNAAGLEHERRDGRSPLFA